MAGVHEPRLQAAAHAVDDRPPLRPRPRSNASRSTSRISLMRRERSPLGRATRVRSGVGRWRGAPTQPSANTAGSPPVWTNTTSSPAPQRPVAALPSSPAKPLPVYVAVEHPAAVDGGPADRLGAGLRRHAVVGAEPAVVDLDVVVDATARRSRSAPAPRRPAPRTSGTPAHDALGDADREHGRHVVVAERPQQGPAGDEPGVGAAARRRVHDRRRRACRAGGTARRARRRRRGSRARRSPCCRRSGSSAARRRRRRARR